MILLGFIPPHRIESLRARCSRVVEVSPAKAFPIAPGEDQMIKICIVFAFVFFAISVSTVPSSTQTPARVDFATEVLPLLRQNCVVCHGPAKQEANLRFDRRSSVLKSFSRRIVPGSSANSFVYQRLIGNEFGMQMPPTGPLRPEQIAIIRTWIDQGADWPDSLANEVDLPPANPKARHGRNTPQ